MRRPANTAAAYIQAIIVASPVDVTGRKFIYDYKTDTFIVTRQRGDHPGAAPR